MRMLLFSVLLLALAGCAPVAGPVIQPANPEPGVQPANATARVQIATMVTLGPEQKQTRPAEPFRPGYPYPAPEPFTPDPNQPTYTPPSVSDLKMTGNLATYTDEVGGFAFDCPADWIIAGPTEKEKQAGGSYTISLHSPLPTAQNPDQEAVDVIVYNQGKDTYADAVARRRKELQGQPAKIIDEQALSLANGLKATRFAIEIENSSRRFDTVTVINGRMILITETRGFLYLWWYPAIAGSIRAIEK